MQTQMFRCMCVDTYTYICRSSSLSIYLSIYVCVSLYIYIYIYICVCARFLASSAHPFKISVLSQVRTYASTYLLAFAANSSSTGAPRA